MKLLYNESDGKIFYAVKDVNYKYFQHSTNIPLSVFQIDEFEPGQEGYEPNMEKCQDLLKYGNQHRTDINGNGKYYMVLEGEEWTLHERDGWEEYNEDFIS